MANVLSQNEIDSLLNALASGESTEETRVEEKSDVAKLYDFRTANKFSKEHIRTLNVIFENFAYLLSTRFTGLLRTICEVNVVSVEEQRFGEFNNSIPSPVILGVVDMQPLQGSILLDLSAALAYGIVSRLLGGVAEYTESNKSFTEIELVMMENVLHKMLSYLSESWEKVVTVKTMLQRIETSSQFTQITAMNEPAAIITFNIKIDKVEDMMTICIPHVALQPVSKQMTSTMIMMGNTVEVRAGEMNDVIQSQIDNTEVTVSAVFNDVSATIKEILKMNVGDIICLDHNIKEFITVNLEHIPKFRGVVGICGQRQAVQIAEIIKENYDIEQ